MVYDLNLVEFDEEAQTARLLALVGSGTYARCLAMDIGEALGCGGYAAGAAAHPHRDFLGGRRGAARTAFARSSTRQARPGRAQPGRGPGVHPRVANWARATRGWPPTATSCAAFPAGRFRVYGGGRLLGVYEGPGESPGRCVIFPGGGRTMRIYRALDRGAGPAAAGRVVAIGVFDGVHRGHQEILSPGCRGGAGHGGHAGRGDLLPAPGRRAPPAVRPTDADAL